MPMTLAKEAMAFKDFTQGSGDDPGNGNASGIPGNVTGMPASAVFGGQGTGNAKTPAGPEDLGLIDYNKRFKDAPPAMFRDGVIRQSISVLISELKPNLVLTGPAGCGKTRIVEDIARRLAADDPSMTDILKGCTVYEMPLGNLVSGTRYRGDMEEKVLAMVQFLENPENKAILFLDEIHMLTSDSQSSYQEIAQILKPALARGRIRTIGATTVQEARTLLSDPAFSRRFTTVVVDEPTKEQTAEILDSMRGRFCSHYGLLIPETLCREAVEIADRKKKAGWHRPDSAITLMDRACGDALVHRKEMEEKAKTDPMAAMWIQSSLPALDKKQLEMTAHHMLTGHAGKPGTTREELENAFSGLEGQEKAVKTLIEGTLKDSLGLWPSIKPRAWLLAGPTGTGKTESAKLLAKTLTGQEPIILNMAEFHSPASINRIIGSPAGYVGSDSAKELPFDILETNPFQVILLDEFEKCDRGVQRLFMSALEEGYMRTADNRDIDFSKAILMFTTNAGVDRGKPLGFGAKEEQPTASALSKDFDRELLNRFGKDSILFYEPIGENTFRKILENKYAECLGAVRETHPAIPLPDTLPEADLDRMAREYYDPAFNARPAEKAVKDYIETKAMEFRYGTGNP